MSPRERIATILFIEQIKYTKTDLCQGVSYKDIILRKEEKNDDKDYKRKELH